MLSIFGTRQLRLLGDYPQCGKANVLSSLSLCIYTHRGGVECWSGGGEMKVVVSEGSGGGVVGSGGGVAGEW